MQVVKAEMVLWTAGFVLLTLVINAPLLPMVLRLTGLNKGVVPMHSHKRPETLSLLCSPPPPLFFTTISQTSGKPKSEFFSMTS